MPFLDIFLCLFYTSASALVLCLSRFYTPLLEYGKTLNSSGKLPSRLKILDRLLDWTVPRTYFSHFYAYSTLLLAVLIALPSFREIFGPVSLRSTVTLSLFWCQSIRRLYECIFQSNSSRVSRMHILHYIGGILFYTFTPLSLLRSSYRDTHLTEFSIIDYLAIALFIASWLIQYQSHVYLFSLRKGPNKSYRFPDRFSYVLFPHYTSEIAMYSALVLLSQPNVVSPWIVLWLVVDLGVAADKQYSWYIKRFGKDKVKTRARLVPCIW